MKNLFFIILLLVASAGVKAQVIADPSVNPMRLFNSLLLPADPALLGKDLTFTIKVPILNRNLVNGLPSGTCKIKIGLGSKMLLDPAFDLANARLSNYFHWTSEINSGQLQVMGDLYAALPEEFEDTLLLDVKGVILGNSTITTNFLVTNHNTQINLSDENGSNNTSFIPYTIVAAGPVPVTFKDLTVTKKECTAAITLYVENEINLKSYELEVSTDGIQFERKASLNPAGLSMYRFLFSLEGRYKDVAALYFRVRSVDLDGRQQLTTVKKIAGGCTPVNAAYKLILFPNPALSQQRELSVRRTEGVFSGRYTLHLFGANGQYIRTRVQTLNNIDQFKYGIENLSAGSYLLKLTDENGFEYPVLQFQVL
ncbi:T9SS type A sorting domain-containing protein [Ferruginibacter sp. HRS2-29]|uniref:T9SS type A sorting domain-containing protein n=1 Tax=Ferruginibacter sp. HRS2-29 TaxID=2487334 RepID=UPI0020CFCF2B|nr:T9SS type A sorting domain-containing protein [Ferruginibacter sp. HRS2-29]MCP9751969.1 T9SS C-terminal target domain-containing protein [Ferruginibacter sp. HRS2-29]